MDFRLATDDRVQFVLAAELGQIFGVAFNRPQTLGLVQIAAFALTQFLNRLQNPLATDAKAMENLVGLIRRFQKGEEQMFGGDKFVAQITGDFAGGVQNLDQFRRQINLISGRKDGTRLVTVQTFHHVIGQHNGINFHSVQNVRQNALVLQKQSGEKMSRTDLILAALNRQFVGLANHLLGFGGKIGKWRNHKKLGFRF